MVSLVSTVVLKLSGLEVTLDLIEAILGHFKRLFNTNNVKINAINREFLISCLRENLLIDVELGCV